MERNEKTTRVICQCDAIDAADMILYRRHILKTDD